MTKTRAGIWLRVSTGKQEEASQLPDCTTWCEQHGYEVAETYVVHGKSAFHGEQDPDWKRVVADVRSGRISVVVIWKVDRLDRRNILHAVPMVNAALEAGGTIEFVTQPYIDLGTMPGRMAFGNLCEMAHEESKTKSDRVKIKHAALRAAGSLTNRSVFGFRVSRTGDGKTLIQEPAEADAIKRMVQLYLKGYSLRKLCAILDAEGIDTWGGLKWDVVSLAQIFRNPALVGRKDNGDGKVLKVPAILSHETWRMLQAEMDRKANRKGVSPQHAALLTGVLSCIKCGGPMYRITGTNTRKDGSRSSKTYYRCHYDGSSKKPSRCGNMIPLEELDAGISQILMALRGSHPVTERVVIPGHDHADKIADVKADIRELDPCDTGFDTRLSALRAELARLLDLPAEPPRVTVRDTGVTVAGHWAGLDVDGRRKYMTGDMQVSVLADKDRWWVFIDNPFGRPFVRQLDTHDVLWTRQAA